MKKCSKICVWGGVSLLILALVASICLAVLPQNLTNEYENAVVSTAETYVQDGITYETIYLTDDDAYNIQVSRDAHPSGSTGNYRYVMTADWTVNIVTPKFCGNAVILDLNGHTVTLKDNVAALAFYAPISEVTDSSTTRTGKVIVKRSDADYSVIYVTYAPCQTFIISGGSNDNDKMHFYSGNVIFKAGNYQNPHTSDTQGLLWRRDTSTQSVTIAPYLVATYNDNNPVHKLVGVQQYDAYAVSNTEFASGAYNYQYGLAWEMNCAELINLAIPDDKIYYLWGRNADGWYQYLNLRYVDGAWQSDK